MTPLARPDRERRRIARYYADLRAEVFEQASRARGKLDADASKFAARLEGLDREEHVRGAELRQKRTLRVQLRLITLLVVRQSKHLLRSVVQAPGRIADGRLDLVWDPLIEAIEAVPCPRCGHPKFALALDLQGALTCPSCVVSVAGSARRGRGGGRPGSLNGRPRPGPPGPGDGRSRRLGPTQQRSALSSPGR